MSTGRRARLATLLSIALVLAVGGIAIAVFPSRPAAMVHAGELSPSPSPSPTVSTKAGETGLSRAMDLHTLVNALLDKSEKALMAGDLDGFLKPATQDASRDELSRRFRNLLALKVTQFNYAASVPLHDAGSGQWTTRVQVVFCFVVTTCGGEQVEETMVWADRESGPELVSVAAPKDVKSWFGSAQPWELSDLHVLQQDRVLVATTARLAPRLPQLLREALEAATVADTFITAGRKPTIYRVYLADTADWKVWYDGDPPKWSAGYATPTGAYQSDIVINNAKVRTSDYNEILRHEMTHVSTVRGLHTWKDNWWLIEGIADLASGQQYSGSVWASETRSYVRGKWDKKLPLERPASDASDSEARARYGVAYLAIRAIDEKYGRDKLLEFFTVTVVTGKPARAAAELSLGTTWDELQTYCVNYIRASA